MALFLRTTDANGKAYGGFQWPLEIGATVSAPDWNPVAKCGNGLHGLLNGEGDASHLLQETDAIWWIVEAEGAIDLGAKHKFESCSVVDFGDRDRIVARLKAETNAAVHYCRVTGGDRSTLTGGDRSTLTGGNDSTLTGGNRSTLTGGNDSTLTGGYYSTLTGGNRSTLTGGYYSTLIFLRWINGRRRVLDAYVGEDGILPGVAYRASDDFKAVIAAVGASNA